VKPFIDDPDFKLYVGHVLDVLRELPDRSVHCALTSPPYFGLRDYGTGAWEGGDPDCEHRVGGQVEDSKAKGAITSGVRPGVDASRCLDCGATRVDQQLGLEKLHDCNGWATGHRCGECYVCRMTEVFREVKRVLRDDGTFWLNIGDSYASSSTYNGARSLHTEHDWKQDSDQRPNVSAQAIGLKAKNLVGIPWRLAFSLQADGWILRAENIWHKPNVMPESANDRTTRAHEQVFMLVKQRRYFFDKEAIKEDATWERWGAQSQVKDYTDVGRASMVSWRSKNNIEENLATDKRNPRSVWSICTVGFPDAHFAVFPPELPMKCILAGTSEKGCCPTCGAPWERGEGWKATCKHEHGEDELVPGVVLDPFIGSGTTAVVARQLGRHSVGIELSEEYARGIVEGRTAQQGLLV
jgi:site-specific DNA-methyltransferase (cytosine-N4-specific)